MNRHRNVTAGAALGHDRHPPVRMGAELRVTLLQHPQQDVLVEHQHRPGLNAQKLRVRLERHLGSIDRNERHAMRRHIEFNSVQRLVVGNRFQKRDDPLRLEELQRIIQSVARRNHLFPGGEFPGERSALPQKAADLNPEEPFVASTPEVQHAGSGGFRRQQRERERQRNLLRNRERTREMQQLSSVRCSDALRRKVDSPQDEPRTIAIRNRSRQGE